MDIWQWFLGSGILELSDILIKTKNPFPRKQCRHMYTNILYVVSKGLEPFYFIYAPLL